MGEGQQIWSQSKLHCTIHQTSEECQSFLVTRKREALSTVELAWKHETRGLDSVEHTHQR